MPRLLARTETIAKPQPSLNPDAEALSSRPLKTIRRALSFYSSELLWVEGGTVGIKTQLQEMMTLTKFALLGSSPISNSVVVHSDIRLLSRDCPWTASSSSSSYRHAVRDPRKRKVGKERTFDDGTTIMMSCCCTMSTTCSSAESLAGRLFGPGEEGENWWDDKCLFYPVVVKEPSSAAASASSWRMYYYGRNQDSWHSGVKPALLSTGRVGVALSEDGFHWKRYRGTLPEGAILDPDEASSSSSFDCVHVGCGDVFFFEGEWWMFYFGGSAETIEFGARGAGPGKALQGFRMLPGLIKSTDGFVFNRKHSPGSPLLQIGRKNEFDEVFIAWPRVIPPPCKELEGQFLPMNKEQWLMTYSSIQRTSPPVSAIGAATSSDGLQWTKAGCVLARGAKGTWDDGGVGRRHVLFLDGQYVMFYEGVDGNGIHGIGLAFSTDGIHWKKDTVLGTEPGGPIFRARIGEEEAWDNGTVAAPHVVQLDDSSFRLYYVGSNALKTQSAIGVALSDGTNFRSWIRPILSLPS